MVGILYDFLLGWPIFSGYVSFRECMLNGFFWLRTCCVFSELVKFYLLISKVKAEKHKVGPYDRYI